MTSNKAHIKHFSTLLPVTAYNPLNRCNIPAKFLGSLTFQQTPYRLIIDSVHELYGEMFRRIQKLKNSEQRAEDFCFYLNAQFGLNHPEKNGFEASTKFDRSKATYEKLIRGWFFDPNSIEGAVFKRWVESRFGLLPRFHISPIRTTSDAAYQSYIQHWAYGVYNTNALESQLDLLFTYCQFELEKRVGDKSHLTLYRGCNYLEDYETLKKNSDGSRILLLNNLNSFSSSRERADEFGDYILRVQVPINKIVFFSALLPGMLRGEDEYMVIGGIYRVTVL